MSPERKKTVNGHLVEEYYQNGKFVVYINHHLTDKKFDDIKEEQSEKDDTPSD